jgi:mono/diheme cytochrome c family protein
MKSLLFFSALTLLLSCQFNESKEEFYGTDGGYAHTNVMYSSSAEAGRELFHQNCASCHSVNDKIIGPPLKGADTLDRSWVYRWVQDSQALIKSGDKRANKIFQEYRMMLEPPSNLTTKQIDDIMNYIREASVSSH